jgi:hypothetical protein
MILHVKLTCNSAVVYSCKVSFGITIYLTVYLDLAKYNNCNLIITTVLFALRSQSFAALQGDNVNWITYCVICGIDLSYWHNYAHMFRIQFKCKLSFSTVLYNYWTRLSKISWFVSGEQINYLRCRRQTTSSPGHFASTAEGWRKWPCGRLINSKIPLVCSERINYFAV